MSSIFEEIASRGFAVPALKHDIDEIIRLTIASIQPFLSNNYKSMVSVSDEKSRCFELLGFDIIIDENARPWLLEVNHMPMLGVNTQFDADLKSSVIKGVFTILGLTPGFKRRVMRREKAESEKRINGITSLPLERIFDPNIESRVAAENTDWRQLYPLLPGDISGVETAIGEARTCTMASIDNGAFRARQRAVKSHMKEKHEIPPPRPPKTIPVQRPARTQRRTREPLARQSTPVSFSAIYTRGIPMLPSFAAAPPMFIIDDEEVQRRTVLARQAWAAMRLRINVILFQKVPTTPLIEKVRKPPGLKPMPAVVARPQLKVRMSIHSLL
jgi:tubulin polyglutamylase TTLL6/13